MWGGRKQKDNVTVTRRTRNGCCGRELRVLKAQGFLLIHCEKGTEMIRLWPTGYSFQTKSQRVTENLPTAYPGVNGLQKAREFLGLNDLILRRVYSSCW